MPKTKEGTKITWKEFFKRWKQGILKITPYQQAQITYHNMWIILLGIVCGLFVTALLLDTLWWLILILTGALGNTIIAQVANYQKYMHLKKLKEEFGVD